MNRLLGLTMGAAALSLSVLVAAPAAEKRAQKLEKVDLTEMRDGETRSLGKGDHAITATRKGDVITLDFGDGDGGRKSIKCTVGKDSCYAMTAAGDGKAQVIVLNKSGKDGKELDRIVVHSGSGDEEGAFAFSSTGEGGAVIVDALGEGMAWAAVDGDEALPGMKVIHVRGDAGNVLECPEGDATLTLKKGDEDSGPYFCPKHNVKLEKAKGHTFVKRIEVRADSKEKDEE